MLRTLFSRIIESTAPRAPMRNVVAVIGTTGVGKSQLAVSLAQHVGSQDALILSADSMQLYKGLDVITNKVTEEEQGGIRHWGLDIVQPGSGPSWEVGKWCGEADEVIAKLPEQTLPILCGGTHYFIQHFLFPPGNLAFSTERQAPSVQESNVRWRPPCALPSLDLPAEYQRLLETFWTSEPVWPGTDNNTQMDGAGQGGSRRSVNDPGDLLSQWKLLDMVDPDEAQRWHWKDGRKVKRGIERWWERLAAGVPEHAEAESSTTKPKVKGRFRTLIFWVYDTMDNLRPRLDKRVDRMVENGLLQEIQDLRAVAKAAYGREEGIGHEEGIFQAIGYKEFAALNLPRAENDPAYGPALERTKISTHQYAKSQLQWIRKQLLPVVRDARRAGGQVYVYVVKGGVEGEADAKAIMDAFLSSSEMPPMADSGSEHAAELLKVLVDPSAGAVPDIQRRQVLNARRPCPECSEAQQEPVSVLVKDWDDHVGSKSHARSLGALFKASDPEGWLQLAIARSARGGARNRRRKEQRAAGAAGSDSGAESAAAIEG